jgi:transaldolase/glucose-6-phosphate isomerase
MNPLLELLEHGQSYWLDNLTRRMIRNGELERRVREEGLRGVTSNPAIFSKAISGGGEYDEQIAEAAADGRSLEEIYEAVVVSDIRDACDVLRPVHDESGGEDGFVSLEVSPHLAHDTQGSVEEARRLFRRVDRPNVFIKIPGTPEGVPAIEELLYEGVNVNVTLLFSVEAYEAVARAYLRALERRAGAGRDVDDVSSVASFFLSRIDVLVDGILGHYLRPEAEDEPGPRPDDLMGEAALANAKIAYRRFLEIFSGERWEALAREGARPQRMLWASTSTKDPLYSDVRYVEPLVGPYTVNTLPERTISAFADHGRVDDTVEIGMDEADATLEALDELGVDFDHVTDQLLHEGVQKFIDPYDRLMAVLADRRRDLLGRETASVDLHPGPDVALDGALASLRRRRFGRRLAARDPALWADGPDEAEAVEGRLGWLDGEERVRDRLSELAELAAGVAEEGVRDVVLLGMGGSVEAARTIRDVLGSPDDPRTLTVLDDTHPDAVRAVEEEIDLERALFVVASKSGTTVETLSLYRHFLEAARERFGEDAGARFVAVTDPGTPLAEEAERVGFRRVVLAPEDVGGRYSALFEFGVVPPLLAGTDVGPLLKRAAETRAECDPVLPPGRIPGVPLGAALGLAARAGRDKATVFLSPGLEGLERWLEQLLAESLGKDGVGVVPVAGERPATASAYGDDRFFVHVRLAGAEERGVADLMDELRDDGHPVVEIELPAEAHLGGEFLRWEVAAATAGSVLGVNPFDEPDVDEAKSETARLLEQWREDGALPDPPVVLEDRGMTVHGDASWVPAGAEGLFDRLAGAAGPGDYFSLLAYLPATPARAEALEAVRRSLWGRTGRAVTAQFGPRYLHSTGQMHKGGPDTGVHLILTAGSEADLEVPGAGHSFGVLNRAQALADHRILERRGRRVLRVHLDDPDDGLARLQELFTARERVPARTAG